MKRTTLLTNTILAVIITIAAGSCDSKREPGKIYMPDMAYSRAIETYALLNDTVFTTDPTKRGKEIFYNAKPVDGTLKLGGLSAYSLPDDSAGYAMSASIKNPMPALSHKDSLETSRLFNIHCAICHGAEGKANGPLTSKIGAIANLTTDLYVKMADGTMFHSIQYGKNNMGSYASQLNSKQRWQLVQYIRTLQPKATVNATSGADATAATAATTAMDSTKIKKGN
jgi:cytochrome c553